MVVRKIVHIDEELCDGCGQCLLPCAEGAIELVDGKAKVIREELCDGAGFCILVCPTGALTIEEREAPEFSEEAAMERTRERAPAPSDVCCSLCGAADAERPLLACRWKGESVWVCVRCLPPLIHG